MTNQDVCRPVFEDKSFHVLLSLAVYGKPGIAALPVRSHETVALFGVGVAALLLPFIGIHNAWCRDKAIHELRIIIPMSTLGKI